MLREKFYACDYRKQGSPKRRESEVIGAKEEWNKE